MQIEGKDVSTENNYLDPVTYIPNHALGNAAHEDAEQGVIISVQENGLRVLYCKSRTVQFTHATNLRWG